MRSLLSLSLLAAGLSAASSPAQVVDPTGKLHPYLATKVQIAAKDAKLPVYFVIRERFPFDEWYPKLLQKDIEERRRIAMRELKAHAARTQKQLLATLRIAERGGKVEQVRIGWIGNFVLCRATAGVIAEAATLPTVREVWYDSSPPLSQVEDAPAPAPGPFGPPLPPGNGPRQVNADKVWAMGIDGRGVIVMNADSGMVTSGNSINHNALRNQVWRNPGETFNGRDDDNNGKVDDVYGWDFGSNNNGISDGGGHGTNCAGCMVADNSCNNTTYGIAPGGKVMTGQLRGESTQWLAVQYAIAEGAHTQTSSHSYKIYFRPAPNYSMHRDVSESSLLAGLIRTNSTSNDGSRCTSGTQRRPFNISAPGNVPPPYIDPNQKLVGRRGGVIGVGAWFASSNNLASYSPCGPFAWNLAEIRARVSFPHSYKSIYNDYPTSSGRMGLLKPDVASPTGTTTTSSSGCRTRTFGGTSNATPNAMGCMMLWKSANMSLKPEDIAMIVHQTSRDRGSVRGKENRWGVGVIDALAGVKRALCVHRVNGDPAWTLNHKAGRKISFELDGSTNKLGVLFLGGSRQSTNLGFVTLGLGQPLVFLTGGSTGSSGSGVGLSFTVPSGVSGATVYSQGFIDDTTGPTKQWLASNVVGTKIVP